MSRTLSLFKAGVTIVAVGAALIGCPNNSRIVLIVAPDELNFGDTAEELTFSVAKSRSDITMPPFVVSSGSPGIVLLDCTSPADDCVSSGPIDPIEVRVRVDRSLMEVGVNAGSIRVETQGIVTRFVDTLINSPVVADFEVDNRLPTVNEDVTFTDNSSTAPGWEIIDWSWDLGSRHTSTQQDPSPVSYSADSSYAVALTITATDGTITNTYTAQREDFIIVGDRVSPTARFTASDTAPFADEEIQFTDMSAAGTSPIEAWEWRFGDGESSRDQHPAHTYRTGGAFDVYLKVVTKHGFDELVVEDFITVEVDPPAAAFGVDDATPNVGDAVQFTDESLPGSAAIIGWLWEFGDGGISAERDPVNVYLEAGVFTVSLTVETAHASDTVIMTDFIEVGITQPTAALSVDNRRALPGDTLQFTDRSVPGTAPVTAWAWSFGDGSVSTDLNPAHQYASEGSYEVALRVTTAHGEDVVVEPAYIVVTAGTALDAYVRQEDPSYNYVGVNTITGTPGVVGHVIDMISQTWRAETEVDEPMWDHWLTIIEPAAVTQSTALLFVAAGDMYGDAPTMINANLADLATATGSVVAVVEQTPGQPLQFANDSFPRSGNALIAHSFDRFLTSFEAAEQDDFRTVPDFSWPALLPMVKAAVRAMDTVQTFLDDDRSSNKVVVENFVVSGLGIRGWTAWLTAIVDGRVTGAVPMAYDFVNMSSQATHHFNVYSFFSETLFDYVESDVYARLDTPAGQALRDIVDPISYSARYATLPKLIISSTGDQSFVPDSSRFYLSELPGETKIAYIPNTDQNLDSSAIMDTLGPWYSSVIGMGELPEHSWEIENGNRLVVTPMSEVRSVRLWTSTSQNRDFRFDDTLNQFPVPEWTSQILNADGNGQYAAFINAIPGWWTGFLIQLEYDSGFSMDGQNVPYVFTTEVGMVPRDTFPVQDFVLPSASFTANNVAPTTSDPVSFMDTSPSGSGPIIRWLWSFGDGMQSNEANPSHTYSIPGAYTVTLEVASVHGSDTIVRSDYVTVSAK